MPADNHDLAAAVTGGKLDVACGVTNDYKGTGCVKAFDEIWELDPRTWSWRAAARFARPRTYCGTGAFGERVRIAGGDILHEDGQRRATRIVETYDPKTGALERAPDLPLAPPRPLAQAAAGRLWVVGTIDREDRTGRGSSPAAVRARKQGARSPKALPKMRARRFHVHESRACRGKSAMNPRNPPNPLQFPRAKDLGQNHGRHDLFSDHPSSARLNTTLPLAPLIAFTRTIHRSPKSKKCI
jgi:hypothetical protein